MVFWGGLGSFNGPRENHLTHGTFFNAKRMTMQVFQNNVICNKAVSKRCKD